MTAPASRTAEIRRLARAGHMAEAEASLRSLMRDLFGIEAEKLRINRDRYSLNSLNGFFDAAGNSFFFKFHQEENEEAMAGEYYRADILARAGLPVDRPVHASSHAGEQILVYRRRNDRRFADVLRDLDLADDPDTRRRAVEAERRLSVMLADVQARTLHRITADEAAAEPIHRLFHERLVDPGTRAFPGGRLRSFYIGRTVRLPGGVALPFEEFERLSFVVNGVRYARCLRELFAAAHDRLAPSRLAGGGVVAHGDAHNANVWYVEDGEDPRLVLFDPAFAGENVPALLAEVKATFHNVFAHPFWLYDPEVAATRFQAAAEVRNGELHVETDWALGPVRRELLAVKAEDVWRPLLALLSREGLLPEDWRLVVRLALFLCPTLVMNLLAGEASHNPTSSLIGFSLAVMVGSEPLAGEDEATRFLDAIDPNM